MALSLQTLYEEGVTCLKKANILFCEKEVRLLLCHSFNLEPHTSFLRPSLSSPDPKNVDFYKENLQRRASREPMAYILGVKEFWSLPFYVSSICLIPRPDSETLVEAVLNYYKKATQSLRILDMGTGSGCLLLALLSELPQATGVGVDISCDALSIAQKNAFRLHLVDKVNFLASDWVSAINGRFDIIISNPPYIEDIILPYLQPDVYHYEPHLALSGGKDGLVCYRTLLRSLKEHLTSKGRIFLEIGQGQENALYALCQENNLMVESTRKDLQGIIRCLVLSSSS